MSDHHKKTQKPTKNNKKIKNHKPSILIPRSVTFQTYSYLSYYSVKYQKRPCPQNPNVYKTVKTHVRAHKTSITPQCYHVR